MGNRLYHRWLRIIFFLVILAGCGSYVDCVKEYIPDHIYINAYSDGSVDLNLPFVGTIDGKSRTGDVIETSVNFLEPVVINSGENEVFELQCRLFGIFDIKKISVSVCDTEYVVACGNPIGIYINTDGILVVDVGDVTSYQGESVCPSKDIILPGDYIITVNGISIQNKEQLIQTIKEYGNAPLQVGIRRDGKETEVSVKPVLDGENEYKIGVWVRDDCQGLGTLTYVTKDNRFGALGHAISESNIGEMVEISTGTLYTAKIWSIVKGEDGTPGEVIGSINYGDDNVLGTIMSNTDLGVYGLIEDSIFDVVAEEFIEVAYKQDIQKGPAYIRTYVDGDIRDYEIKITKIHYDDQSANKGIEFCVVDEELLSLTNGIVQGMSGSPIIQNGKIIGAVTHVFVHEPEKGYGIFIENMLDLD